MLAKPVYFLQLMDFRRVGSLPPSERIGWHVERPLGTMFVCAVPIPEPYRELGLLEFAVTLTREAHVSVSPGVGFGPGGDGFVRFALVENEQRIAQAVRGLRLALPELAGTTARA